MSARINGGRRNELLIAKGIGRRRTISISKTRKITASRKNRREKGIRAFFLGSNPHSKGEVFSRSKEDRADRAKVVAINRRGNNEAIIIEISVNCMSLKVSTITELKAQCFYKAFKRGIGVGVHI
jgi:hypothetical protein